MKKYLIKKIVKKNNIEIILYKNKISSTSNIELAKTFAFENENDAYNYLEFIKELDLKYTKEFYINYQVISLEI